MPTCAVATCKNSVKNTKNQNVSFFRFPRDCKLRKIWVTACRRADHVNEKNAVLCSHHFKYEEINGTLQQELLGGKVKRTLNSKAVPTLNLPSAVLKAKSRKDVSGRHKRHHQRDIQRRLADKINALSPKKKSSLAANTLIDSVDTCDSSKVNNMNQELAEMKKKFSELEVNHKQVLKKIKVLERRVSSVRCEKVKLQAKLAAASKLDSMCHKSLKIKIQEVLKGVLSRSQIHCIMSKCKQGRWEKDDILKALSLRALSKKSYLYVRKKMRLPLPGISTLQRWTKDFQIPPGILYNVLEMMKSMVLSDFEKHCILSFDEMNLDSRICYDHQSDTVFGPYSNAQVIMVRGLFDKWKQPIFYDFDRQITKEILLRVIAEVEKAKYHVVACVSDLGSKNSTVWKTLNINEHNASFVNPSDASRRVWVFADFPHLIKLLRNHTIDEGIILESGKCLTSSVFRDILEKDCGEFKLCPKLSDLHLTCSGRERQRVYLATQLFSRHTAEALCRLSPNSNEFADFILLVNNVFDVFNSSIRLDETVSLRSGYGTNLKQQAEVLLEMRRVCTKMRVAGKNKMLPFQKGILLSITSLFGLFKDLSSFGGTFILTRRLNQDCLEHFFSQVRGLGRFYDHPLPSEFKNRMRLLLIGTNIDCLNLQTCAQDEISEESPTMITNSMFIHTLKETDTSCLLDEVDEMRTLLCEGINTMPNQPNKCRREMTNEQLACEKEGMRYVAGYVAFRCLDVDPTLGSKTGRRDENKSSWINSISTLGSFIEPTKKWMDLVEEFEPQFFLHNGDSINLKPKIIENFEQSLKNKYPLVHPKVIKIYCRTRTFIRLKFLNKENAAAARAFAQKKKTDKWIKSAKKTTKPPLPIKSV